MASLLAAWLAPLLLVPMPWLAPMTPLIVERPFSAPAGPYSPGHRGIDLWAERGAIVRAPAPGVVRVAGRVAGKDVVSIEHADVILGRTGWRSTYEGVTADVRVGDRVARGSRLGTALGRRAGDAHTQGVHWGVKHGRTYIDPLRLLQRRIVLKPLGGD